MAANTDKFCINCEHYTVRLPGQWETPGDICIHQETVNPVTGIVGAKCKEERSSSGHCGIEGKNYERKKQ